MAYTSIDKSDEYFNTVTWSGNGSTQSLTGVNFQPDWVWIKRRDAGAFSHRLNDVVRGATKALSSDNTDAEFAEASGLTSFDSDGFSIGSNSAMNASGGTYVGWNWLADNTSGSSNTDGSITSTVSANTTSGFSIVTYTGTGANATIGHGLGVAPKMIIFKMRTGGTLGWYCYNSNLGATNHLVLNDTASASSSSILFNDTEPTSSVMSVGTSPGTNQSSATYVAYCFAEKKGFSKFGTYTGNLNADGTFIYTGFKPSFFLVRHTSSPGNGWWIFDNKRQNSFNVVNARLLPNSDSGEGVADYVDFVSNGMKIRNASSGFNESGQTYIYMAFAEHPLVSSTGTPVTAR